ncbi:glycoside hydrolase/deacetylase [Stereum hirsutum FP-91666 SS1]|uniref:glycoside hydrolase/deacetylase n=1 Tax=Stereum hirsutum (strain FP-91666) TaxID=721885 RepID=UPI000444A46C|nr:glycoside hydrolase/deacetylase [Stereum hirsutum FP-91666 SS1]EIM83538.1 glycoside hydrolase/deacetylase [Stereum hirsutum FP-91666 SS1]
MFLLTTLSIAALPALALGHNNNHLFQARQASTTSSSAAASSSGSTSAASGSSASGASVTAASSGASSLPAPSVSLLSTNPTAVPLTQIVSNAPSAATGSVTTTFAAGSTPSAISGAPGLPDISKLSPSNYPALDTPPPTDSAEVQQWIKDVANSGVTIPDIPLTVAGGCPSNPNAVTNASQNGWWTCGGYTRDTDIVDCPDKMTWGLTYDDGPAFYTPDLLAYLDQVNLKSTFFTVGSRVISFPGMLQEEYMAGHQIAVHTWSHPSLTTLSNEEIIAEFGWSKKVIYDVLGVTPNQFRPPFGDIDDRVRAIAKAMGLTPVIWTRISATATFDTGDFDIHAGTITPQQVLQNWENIMGNASAIDTGFIVLEHDLFQQTVELATGYILPDAIAHGSYNIMPVISCLNLPLSDAYIETNDNSTNPPAVSGTSLPRELSMAMV